MAAERPGAYRPLFLLFGTDSDEDRLFLTQGPGISFHCLDPVLDTIVFSCPSGEFAGFYLWISRMPALIEDSD